MSDGCSTLCVRCITRTSRRIGISRKPRRSRRFCARSAPDPAAILERAVSVENKAKLREQSERAATRGIFGAPAFFAGDEMFWGSDGSKTRSRGSSAPRADARARLFVRGAEIDCEVVGCLDSAIQIFD